MTSSIRGGYVVTRDVRTTAAIATVTRVDKARANRRSRRALRAELKHSGEDALLTPKLYTGWDVA